MLCAIYDQKADALVRNELTATVMLDQSVEFDILNQEILLKSFLYEFMTQLLSGLDSISVQRTECL